ncbi:host attachment protein [Devosia oryziradicis]|jgi:protein required for attachment to host cells|uniref:Host attachment protein n=1 Tax=Devosia oryziradicis TaxID=2801335 RepID=A0ABX7BTX5_9HYPH|nr:host attachment protein [Devosia oryziradicis]QQR34499.1 host attachment protein [Devosia oryziradicis]
MKKTVTWVLIADGAQARVLENTGPGKGLKQVDGLDWAIDPLQAQDIVTDRPGSKSGGGAFGGGMEPRTDPVEHRETQFVKSVAATLDRKQQQGAFDRLVIAAAPIALGDLRKAISPAVKKAVVAELNKDLTNVPTAQLNQHLDGILAA